MHRILVVDDEAPIREWVEFCLHSKDASLEIQTARNGEEALALCEKNMPELVITDIMMPVMDGIELTRRIRLTDMRIPVVFLTSYTDFEYARQAVKLGAAEYVLKTEIDKERLWGLLARLEEESGSRPRQPDLEMQQFRSSCFFQALMTGAQDKAINEEALRGSGIPLCDRPLFAIALSYPSVPERVENLFTEEMREGKIYNITGFSYNRDTFLFLMNMQPLPSTLYRLQFLYAVAQRLYQKYGCTIGLSQPYDGLCALREAVLEAVAQLGLSFYDAKGRIYQAAGGAPDTEEGRGAVQRQCKRAIDKMKEAGVREAAQEVECFFEAAQSARLADIQFIRGCAVELVEYAREYGAPRGDALQLCTVSTRRVTEAAKLSQVYTAVQETLDIFGTQARLPGSLSANVRQAVQYIDTHYAQNISLNEVASHVGLSAEYLSRLFKDEAGMTYTSYLTSVRMRRAEQLLCEGKYRVYEVAQLVGYPNLSYFSTLFKKRFGVNPFEYQNTGRRM